MAYAAAETRTEARLGGRLYLKIVIVETGVTVATNEYTLTSLPLRGTMVEHRCVLATGGAGITATAVDPELGAATTTKEIFENGAAAASTTNLNQSKGFTGPTLYGRSGSDGNIGSTGTITTTITIMEGSL